MVEQFVQGRKYLKAVSPKTLIWYQCSFKAFDGATSSKGAINRRIVELRERGVSPITINSYLRCINAYLRWLHEEHRHGLPPIYNCGVPCPKMSCHHAAEINVILT